MPEYQITYRTQNVYSQEMKHALVEFLVLPANEDSQTRVSYNIRVSPLAKEHLGVNCFGFDALTFRLNKQHQRFQLTMEAVVTKEERNPFEVTLLPFETDRRILTSDNYAIDNYPFLQNGPLSLMPQGYHSPTIHPNEMVFDFAIRVNQFVNRAIRYSDKSANPQKTIAETLNEQAGVCQDYAHLMLAILRKNSIPARYVSGYLHPGESFVGTGAVHAWIQARIPGIGWIGLDPTNNLLEDHHYIKIAHGVDINDCPNVKGVIIGPGGNETNYSVLVAQQNKTENQ